MQILIAYVIANCFDDIFKKDSSSTSSLSLPEAGYSIKSLWYFEKFHSCINIISWFDRKSKNYDFIKKMKYATTDPDVDSFVYIIGNNNFKNGIYFSKYLPLEQIGDKPTIFIQSLTHPRERITVSTVQYFVEYLTENVSKDPQIKKILDDIDIVIIPIVNIDGCLELQKNPLQRTNKNNVDINRNFPISWNSIEWNGDEETYPGPTEGSEYETNFVMDLFNYFSNKVVGSIDFHSFGQLILYPKGYEEGNTDYHDKFKELGELLVSKFSMTQNSYNHKSLYDHKPASGMATDWFYSKKIHYAITIELPPILGKGDILDFKLSAKDIIKTGESIIPVMLSFIEKCLIDPLISEENGFIN